MNGKTTGGLRQSFATEIGKTYRVMFDMSGAFMGGSSIKYLTVTAGNATGNVSYSYSFEMFTGWSVKNMGWTSKGFDFTANDTVTTLSFDSGNTGYYGPAIDNVSVRPTPTPEPSAMVLGIFALAGFRTGRKKNTK